MPAELDIDRQLRCVVALADRLHFRLTAQELGMSQPALSARIKAVEDMVGVQLFNRTTRRVEVSAAGRAFVAQARQALAALECGTRDARMVAAAAHRQIPEAPEPGTVLPIDPAEIADGSALSLTDRLVPDSLWRAFRRIVPHSTPARPQGGGRRPLAGDRDVLAAVIYLAVTDTPWRTLPPVFGVPWGTAYRRFTGWTDARVWSALQYALQDESAPQNRESTWSATAVAAVVRRAASRDASADRQIPAPSDPAEQENQACPKP